MRLPGALDVNKAVGVDAMSAKLLQMAALGISASSVVWQQCTKELQQKVEQIQNYGMHVILSKPPLTASSDLRATLKWIPLTEREEDCSGWLWYTYVSTDKVQNTLGMYM